MIDNRLKRFKKIYTIFRFGIGWHRPEKFPVCANVRLFFNFAKKSGINLIFLTKKGDIRHNFRRKKTLSKGD